MAHSKPLMELSKIVPLAIIGTIGTDIGLAKTGTVPFNQHHLRSLDREKAADKVPNEGLDEDVASRRV